VFLMLDVVLSKEEWNTVVTIPTYYTMAVFTTVAMNGSFTGLMCWSHGFDRRSSGPLQVSDLSMCRGFLCEVNNGSILLNTYSLANNEWRWWVWFTSCL